MLHSIICSVKPADTSLDICTFFAQEVFPLGLAYCRVEYHHEGLHHTLSLKQAHNPFEMV